MGAFQQARDLDPGFAPAWAGLGYARVVAVEGALDPVGDNARERDEGLAEVDKSIGLAPRLGEAYAMRGAIRRRARFDWEGRGPTSSGRWPSKSSSC